MRERRTGEYGRLSKTPLRATKDKREREHVYEISGLERHWRNGTNGITCCLVDNVGLAGADDEVVQSVSQYVLLALAGAGFFVLCPGRQWFLADTDRRKNQGEGALQRFDAACRRQFRYEVVAAAD